MLVISGRIDAIVLEFLLSAIVVEDMRGCEARSADPVMKYANKSGQIYVFVEEEILGAFTELRKWTVSFFFSVRLSVCQHGIIGSRWMDSHEI
jgi:hypothetical protein